MTVENNEWGNISLPGLSDNELFGKNWNKVAAGKTIMEKLKTDPTWLEAHQQGQERKKSNPEALAAIADGNRKKAQDPEWIRATTLAQQKKNQNPEYKAKITSVLKERANDPAWRKKMSQVATERAKDPEYRKKLSDAKKGKALSEEHLAKLKENGLKQRKTIVTPFGTFSGRKEAWEKLNISKSALERRMRTRPTEYYYIET